MDCSILITTAGSYYDKTVPLFRSPDKPLFSLWLSRYQFQSKMAEGLIPSHVHILSKQQIMPMDWIYANNNFYKVFDESNNTVLTMDGELFDTKDCLLVLASSDRDSFGQTDGCDTFCDREYTTGKVCEHDTCAFQNKGDIPDVSFKFIKELIIRQNYGLDVKNAVCYYTEIVGQGSDSDSEYLPVLDDRECLVVEFSEDFPPFQKTDPDLITKKSAKVLIYQAVSNFAESMSLTGEGFEKAIHEMLNKFWEDNNLS